MADDENNVIEFASRRLGPEPTITPIPADFGLVAHRAAEEHLDACMAALDAEGEGDDTQWPEDMAGPFCGCQTCMIRETLHAAWPIIIEAVGGER